MYLPFEVILFSVKLGVWYAVEFNINLHVGNPCIFILDVQVSGRIRAGAAAPEPATTRSQTTDANSHVSNAESSIRLLLYCACNCISMEAATNSVEEQRLENIRRNRALLNDLGLHRDPDLDLPKQRAATSRPAKKRKLEIASQPSRSSARIALAPVKPAYGDTDEADDREASQRRTKTSKSGAKIKHERQWPSQPPTVDTPSSQLPQKDVEGLQKGWTDWKSVAPPPSRDEDSTFHFADQPLFLPNKSPEEMIREGCFGGSYFRPLYSRKLGITIADDWRELPTDWTLGLDVDRWLVSPEYNPDVNKYKVSCGQSIEEWEAAGWIDHQHDVRGWFQWYCRFFMGRRCDDDDRQVGRWRKCVGETGRWRRMLLKKYVALSIREVFDDGEDEDEVEVSPVMHQTCHHWAFEVRQNVLDDYWKTGR